MSNLGNLSNWLGDWADRNSDTFRLTFVFSPYVKTNQTVYFKLYDKDENFLKKVTAKEWANTGAYYYDIKVKDKYLPVLVVAVDADDVILGHDMINKIDKI